MEEHLSGPRAREDGLVVQELGDESLVYDRDSDFAHCLSSVAARVWRACDGTRNLPELARFLGTDEDLTAEALEELRAKRLLREDPPPDNGEVPGSGVSRRQALGRMAKIGAGAASVPLIVSAMAGSAQASVSGGVGSPCVNGGTGHTGCASNQTCTDGFCLLDLGQPCTNSDQCVPVLGLQLCAVVCINGNV